MSDVIRELRDLLAGLREPLPWRIEREDTTGEEPNGWIYPHGAYSSTPGVNELIVAAVNTLPALLAVAEAAETAQGMLAVHPRSFGAHLTAEGLLRSALALLGDKP